MNRKKQFSLICIALGTLLLFWWPLSHWLYAETYHSLLGFLPGTYQESMVKMIGTCGLLPVFCLFALAFSPNRNWPLVIAISLFSLFLGLTFLYLVIGKFFPTKEYINVSMSMLLSVLIPLLYKWANGKPKVAS